MSCYTHNHLPICVQVFETISARFGVDDSQFALNISDSPKKLVSGLLLRSQNIKTSDLREMLAYLSDTTSTLLAFLEVYAEGAKAFTANNFLLG